MCIQYICAAKQFNTTMEYFDYLKSIGLQLKCVRKCKSNTNYDIFRIEAPSGFQLGEKIINITTWESGVFFTNE